MTRVSPRTGVPLSRSGIPRRRTRLLALGALILALVALAWVVLGGGSSREYHVIMQNAGQLVPGDIVRIGGVQAGSVKGLELTPAGQADVKIQVDDAWGKLHAGTTITVRASGIATVTGRYVDISPGPSYRPVLADGAPIDIDHTTSIVDIDQLLNALDAPTRQIAENSGADGGVVVNQMRSGTDHVGFDAARQQYVDLFEAGIVDPTKVVRVGLENAVSTASLLLLSEATLTEAPEPKQERSAVEA